VLEVTILAANVLLPLVVMSVAWVIIRSVSARSVVRTDRLLQAGIAVVAASLAIVGAFLVRVEVARSAWPDDAWARIPHALALVGLGSLVALVITNQVLAWLVRATAVFFAARMVIPVGEGWEDIADSAPIWLAFMVGGTLLAWSLIARLPRQWPGVVGLTWISCVVAAAFLSKDFLRVTEPLLAVATVIGMASLMGLFRGDRQIVAAVSGPALFATSAAVANAQFNSFLGLPDALSWLAIMAPGLAALTTLVVPSSAPEAPLQRWKVALFILTCVALAAAVILWTTVAGEAGGADDW
jgi:hypothetical protein